MKKTILKWKLSVGETIIRKKTDENVNFYTQSWAHLFETQCLFSQIGTEVRAGEHQTKTRAPCRLVNKW